MLRKTCNFLCAFALASTLGAGYAQTLPQNIRIVVSNPPGAANDILARIAADGMRKILNTNVIVENAPGASGAIAQRKVFSAPADGSFILLGSTNELLTDVHAGNQKNLQSFIPLGAIASVPFVLVGRPNLPAKSIDELVRLSAQPQTKLTIGGAGLGTYPHVQAEIVRQEMKAPLTYVSYKGSANTLADLMGGHVDLGMMGLPTVLPHLKTGTIRIYGLASAKRSPNAPELPTLLESESLKGLKPLTDAWVGLMVSAQTPLEVRRTLSAAMTKAVASDDVQKLIRQAGAVPTPMSAEELQGVMRSDFSMLSSVVKSANITSE